MISGTSKMSLILEPINGHFWAHVPRICGFSYTKILQRILESIWEHLGKILLLHIWESKLSKKTILRKANPPFVFEIIFCIFFVYIFPKWFCGDEERTMIHFPLLNSTQTWIWIAHLSKNMNSKSPLNFLFARMVP